MSARADAVSKNRLEDQDDPSFVEHYSHQNGSILLVREVANSQWNRTESVGTDSQKHDLTKEQQQA